MTESRVAADRASVFSFVVELPLLLWHNSEHALLFHQRCSDQISFLGPNYYRLVRFPSFSIGRALQKDCGTILIRP